MTRQMLNRFEWAKAVNKSNLLDRAKSVAWALAVNFCNQDTGRTDPGLKELASATGKSSDTLKRAVRDLIEAGWLARTEGRGSGNKTQYTFLLPSQVATISEAKKGPETPTNKRGHKCTFGKKKGARVRPKEGTGALSYIKDKQSLEQKGERSVKCPALTLFVVHAADNAKVSEWNAWLANNGFPSLQQLPIKGGDGCGPGYRLPRRWAPTSEEDQNLVKRYIRWVLDQQEVRYAAE